MYIGGKEHEKNDVGVHGSSHGVLHSCLRQQTGDSSGRRDACTDAVRGAETGKCRGQPGVQGRGGGRLRGQPGGNHMVACNERRQ